MHLEKKNEMLIALLKFSDLKNHTNKKFPNFQR